MQPNGAYYIAHILLFLDDLLMFYQAFGMNLSFNRCGMFVLERLAYLLGTAPL